MKNTIALFLVILITIISCSPDKKETPSKTSVESRRMLNKLLFVEIISYNERGKNFGELELMIRADGKLKSNWPKTVNPELLTSQLRGHWLRR